MPPGWMVIEAWLGEAQILWQQTRSAAQTDAKVPESRGIPAFTRKATERENIDDSAH
jgi:hypothetical protein